MLTRLHIASQPPYWERFRNLYLGAIDSFLARRIEEGASIQRGEGGETHRNEHYSMHELEVYWEFQHDDPVGFMHCVGPALRAIGSIVGYREYPVETENVNSPAYQIELAKGVTLAVYAKTSHRLRVEVRYKPNSITGRLKNGLSKIYTAPSLSELTEVIDRYTNDAAQRVNELIDMLAASSSDLPVGYSAQRLIREVVEACDDHFLVLALEEGGAEVDPRILRSRRRHAAWRPASRAAEKVILSALILRNAYQISEGDPFVRILTQLQRRGIVVSRGRRKTLAPNYQTARNALASLYTEEVDQ